MENVKKLLKSYLKNGEELKEMEREKRQHEEEQSDQRYEIHYYLQNHTFEETREHFKDYYKKETEEEQNNYNLFIKNLECKRIENNIYYNNLIAYLLRITKPKIIETMEKYQNKNIGEKTKEKIQQEIKEHLQQYFYNNENIYIYFHGDYNNFELSAEIRKQKEDKFYYSLKFTIEKTTYNNSYTDNKDVINYYLYVSRPFNYSKERIDENYHMENIKTIAKNIIKETEKAKKQLEKEKQKLVELRKNHNSFIDIYCLEHEEQYKIKDSITLY